MRLAAAGLARRGHDVAWLDPHAATPPPADADGVRVVRRPVDAGAPDVALGAAPGVPGFAWSAWLAGAHAAVIDGGAGSPWSFAARVAWGALDAMVMLEPGVDGGAAGAPLHADPDAVRAWGAAPPPDAPDATHGDVEALERACERLAARRRGLAPRPAVFLDRDGTLVVEVGYLADVADLEVLPGVPGALRALRAAGYALVVVSNQSGVGRGLFPRSRVYDAMARLRRVLRADGVELDAIYFCPHRPGDGCACRKPEPELLRQAAANQRLALRESAMVGDKRLDAETGRRAGASGVLVRTGYGRDEERREAGAEGWPPPAHVAEDLAAAVPWLLERAANRRG
jgi:D-glycero-D-manno-heptose 1,7-bisphosphate phosphatase